MISTEQIKELRDLTGVSIMQCKKALEEAGGDKEKALIILRKKGAEAAAKRSDRTFGAGVVQSYIHSTGTVGVMVELMSETDFVSGNPEFKTLAYDIAMHVAALNPQFLKKDDIDQSARDRAAEVFSGEVGDKPADMKEKILQGKLDAYFKEQVLLDQPFIKNPDVTVGGLIESAIQKFGEKIAIGRFVRFAVNK